MPALSMNGPYKLDKDTIDAKVTRKSPGNYALGKKNEKGTFLVGYVGRSDAELQKGDMALLLLKSKKKNSEVKINSQNREKKTGK